MLWTSNDSGWQDLMNKPLIASADVLVKSGSTTILTKKNIESFKHHEVRRYMGESYPISEITLVVLKWGELVNNADIENYIHIGDTINIAYQLEAITTNTRKYNIVSVDYDKKTDKATIKASWYFQTNPQLFKTLVPIDIGEKWNYQQFDARELLYYVFEGNYNRAKFWIDASNPSLNMYQIEKMTIGEMLQNLAIACGGALSHEKIKTGQTWYDAPVAIYSFSKYFDKIPTYYSQINVVEYTEYPDELGNDPVVNRPQLFGETTLLAEDTGISGETSHLIYGFSDNDYLVESVVATSGTIRLYEQYPIYTGGVNWRGAVWVEFSTNPTQSYTIRAYGRKMSMGSYNTQGKRVVSSPFINAENSNAVQQYANEYFVNDKLADFEGRIDPRFETLDVFESYDGSKYRCYCIEEIDFNFNGGFYGKMKTRIIDNAFLPPVVVEEDVINEYFEVNNANQFDVNVYAVYSGGLEQNIGTIRGGETGVFVEVPQLSNSFMEKRYGNLSDPVLLYFVNSANELSTNTTLLESD